MTFLGKEWLGVTGLGSSACKIPSCFQSGSAELAPVLIRGGGSNPSDLRRRLGSAELHLPRQTQNPLPAMAADQSYSLSGYGGGPDRCVVKVPGIVPGKIPKPASISGKTTKSMVRYEEDASDPTAVWRIATAANHKADRVQQQKGDFQKVMTELHESMDRVEALLQRLVNSQAQTLDQTVGRGVSHLQPSEKSRSVEDLCQINLNSTQGIQLTSTTEGNFKFPSTYPSVVATGWDLDPLQPEDPRKLPEIVHSGDLEIPEVKDHQSRMVPGKEIHEQEMYGIDSYTHNCPKEIMLADIDWLIGDKPAFIEEMGLNTLNKQVRHFTGFGNTPMVYPLKPVMEEILKSAEESGDRRIAKICLGMLKAMRSHPEYNYVAYRKGIGVVCNKRGGNSIGSLNTAVAYPTQPAGKNLSVLCFSNLGFEPLWSKQYIRNEKVKVLHSMKPLQLDVVVIGQPKIHTKGDTTYPGYTDDKTVLKNSLTLPICCNICLKFSLTPTFAAAAFSITNTRWLWSTGLLWYLPPWPDLNFCEVYWVAMVDQYKFKDNKWFFDLYSCRKQWAPGYVNHSFWAGTSATRKVEKPDPYFDGVVTIKTTLPVFHEQYEATLKRELKWEAYDDLYSYYFRLVLMSKLPFEEQLVELCTVPTFQAFQDEIQQLIHALCEEIDRSGNSITYMASELIQGKMVDYIVVYYNAVLIFDEAHNLENICADVTSFDLLPNNFTSCLAEARECIKLCSVKSSTYTLEIHVKMLETVVFDVDCIDTVDQIKSRFSAIEGIDHSEQELFYAGIHLKNENSLTDYNIMTNYSVDPHIIDGMHISAKISSVGKTIQLNVKKSKSDVEVKAEIERKVGILTNKQILSYRGRQLEDNQMLNQCDLRNGQTLHVLVCPTDKLCNFVNVRGERIMSLDVKCCYTVAEFSRPGG